MSPAFSSNHIHYLTTSTTSSVSLTEKLPLLSVPFLQGPDLIPPAGRGASSLWSFFRARVCTVHLTLAHTSSCQPLLSPLWLSVHSFWGSFSSETVFYLLCLVTCSQHWLLTQSILALRWWPITFQSLRWNPGMQPHPWSPQSPCLPPAHHACLHPDFTLALRGVVLLGTSSSSLPHSTVSIQTWSSQTGLSYPLCLK